MSKPPLPTDCVLQQRYRIRKVLGSGGFGITYLGQDQNTQELYAIKEYFPPNAYRSAYKVVISEQESLIKDFIHEVRSFFHLRDCPNIAHLHDVFEENDTFYMVFDYIEGETLHDIIQKVGKINPWEGLGYMEDIAKALDCMHRRQLLHRDVTPNNIIIRPSGQAVLIDFGAARLYENNKTQSMTSILNPGYAPPEQSAGEGHYSPALDIYSFGASFYHALTGELPPNSLKRYMAIHKGKGDMVTSTFLQSRFGIPPCIAELIRKCMEIEEEKRYPNMSAVLMKITECKEEPSRGSTQIALKVEPVKTTTSSNHQSPALEQELNLLLNLLVLILLGVGIGFILYWLIGSK